MLIPHMVQGVPKMTSQIVGLQPIAIPKRCHLDDGKAEMTSAQTLRDLLASKWHHRSSVLRV